MGVRTGIVPRIFVAENLENDRRESRSRAALSIGVDLRIRSDAVPREEGVERIRRLERVRVLVEQLRPFEMDCAWDPAQLDRRPKTGLGPFEFPQTARVPEHSLRLAKSGFA